jgi:DNA-directed RNA polymerase subunit K/omega
MKGAEMTVPTKNNKLVVAALREVAAGNVGYDAHMRDYNFSADIERDLNK